MSIKEDLNFLKSIFSISLKTLKKNSKIFFPFVIIAFFELLALEFIFLAPRKPLSFVLGPPIARLLRGGHGQIYLHYPYNLLLVPKLYYYAQIAISIFIAGFLTAVAILMIQAANQEKIPNFRVSLKNAFGKYIIVFLITLIVMVLMFYGVRIQKILIEKFLSGKTAGILGNIKDFWIAGFSYINFVFAIIIQTLFIFCLPAVMIEKRSLWGSLKRNFSLLKGLFLAAFSLVLLPSLLYLPIVTLRDNLSVLTDKFFPEVSLIIIVLGIILAIFLDAFVTTATTTLFLLKKDTEA